jgi:hypothetical protein
MQNRGATKTAKEKPKGFTTALQTLATTRIQLSLSQMSRPPVSLLEPPLTANLISKVQRETLGLCGGSFYASLFETLLANHVTTVESPESLRQAIAGFAMRNGAEWLAQDFSLLTLLQKHTGRSLTMEEYNDWWQEKRNEEPFAHVPFVMAASMMLNTQQCRILHLQQAPHREL